jgi:hypothetical protein
MSQIRLKLREADGRLPMVCMVCGEPATVVKTKKMSWYPRWVPVLILANILIFAIVAMILTKRARLQAPLCDSHKYHWTIRLVILWVSLFVAGMIGLFGIIVFALLPRQWQDNLGPFLCLGGVLVFIAWVIVLAIVQGTGVRPHEITDLDITLVGVCDEFIDAAEDAERERRALRRSRAYRDEDDDEEPPPRRRRPPPVVDDDEDEPPPRKKRPPPDAFEE